VSGDSGGARPNPSGPGTPPASGLCSRCRHARLVTSGRGSQFILCELSRADERFARYPRLPVLSCAGFEAVETLGAGERLPPASGSEGG
jgi:hypothetical protein